MAQQASLSQKGNSPYSAVLTREQFLFYEVRTTAKLMNEGLSEDLIKETIFKENLFQYPTEKSIKKMASTCVRRLQALDDASLIAAIATQPSQVAKQICLYAMMKQYRIVWDYMTTVIGSKYESCDMTFGRMDVNAFMLRLQEQDNWVASWSENTIHRLKQVLVNVLVENEYLDDAKADRLNPVLIEPILEDAIRTNGDLEALPAFNCLR